MYTNRTRINQTDWSLFSALYFLTFCFHLSVEKEKERCGTHLRHSQRPLSLPPHSSVPIIATKNLSLSSLSKRRNFSLSVSLFSLSFSSSLYLLVLRKRESKENSEWEILRTEIESCVFIYGHEFVTDNR